MAGPETNQAPSPAKPLRIEWVDAAKGIGIVLVVLGHVIAGMSASGLLAGHLASFDHITRFIYSFHMPVFLVLAGVFAPRSVRKPPRSFWPDKLGGLAYPCLLWSVMQFAVQVSMSGYTSNPTDWRDFYTILYRPPMQFWFLYCLFLGFVVYRIVFDLGGGAWAFYAACLIVSLSWNSDAIGGTSVPGRVRDFMPHFALGAVLSPWLLRLSLLPAPILAAVTLAGFGLTIALLDADLSHCPRLVIVLSVPLLGTAAVLALAALLTRGGITMGLIYLGRLSLEIYVAHVIAYAGARIILLKILGITSMPFHLIAGMIVGIGAPVLLAEFAGAVRFPYLFRWPVAAKEERRTLSRPPLLSHS